MTLPAASVYQRAVGRYADDAVATAGPARLLVLLYDRLVLDLSRGEQAQRAGDRGQAATFVGHAQAIVSELLASLDQQAWDGGPGLASLYTWMLTELSAGLVAGDADRTRACLELVLPLRDAWTQAALAPTSHEPLMTAAVG